MENSYVQCYGIYIKLLEIIHNTKKKQKQKCANAKCEPGTGCVHAH